MKKILIPTDFSKNATDALMYTLGFLDGAPAEIHIIHVFNLPQSVSALNYLGTQSGNTALHQATENLSSIENQFNAYSEKHNKQLKVTTRLLKGPLSSIVREADRLKVDLIIMGTQGTNHNFTEKMFGTVSSAVISHSPCPVILIPKGYKYKGIDNILFPSSLNHADPYELHLALQLLQPHSVVLRVLHIEENQESSDAEHLKNFESYISQHSISLQSLFYVEAAKDVEQVIVEYANMYDVEMIVMHKTDKSFWGNLLNRSHTKKMTNLIETPLLVIN